MTPEKTRKLEGLNFSYIAPVGTPGGIPNPSVGTLETKPWEYDITVAIPHLDTVDILEVCIATMRAQSVRVYVLVIDTGSPPEVCAQLEMLRGPDVEIHYIKAHGYRHSSEPVTAAMDLAQSLCRTKHLFHTHSDVLLMRSDFLESMMRICNVNTPAIGYRMSPRDWLKPDDAGYRNWEWMVGHEALTLYMPTIHRIGATWAFSRIHYAYKYPWNIALGWPDTECGFNHALRDAGIKPIFLGYGRNGDRYTDDNIDHLRSLPGSKVYCAHQYNKAMEWSKQAILDATERVSRWTQDKCDGTREPGEVESGVANPSSQTAI